MGAQQLFAANRIGLFTALADGPRDAASLAADTDTAERVTRILADAMASFGLLKRENGTYSLSASSKAYLTGNSAQLDLSPYLTFLEEISYPHWLQFAETVCTDAPGDLGMTDERWGTFLGGVMTYNRLHADMFAASVDVTGHERLLDLGGLAPYFAIRAMEANPALTTTFAYAEGFADKITGDIEAAGFMDRSTVEEVATPQAQPEGPYDLVFLNHVLHRFDAAENRQILEHARAAAAPGAKLAMLDFFLDDDAHQRPIDAMHAGEYLVIDGTVVYPESVVVEWLTETGWEKADIIALPGSPRVLIATAV
jgi:hypothetical protein